jgi:hypothetical protein
VAVFQDHSAGAAHLIAMVLQAGRRAEIVGEIVPAEAVRIAAASTLLGRRMRNLIALRPGGARTGDHDNDETKIAEHGDVSSLLRLQAARGAQSATKRRADEADCQFAARRMRSVEQGVARSVGRMQTAPQSSMIER